MIDFSALGWGNLAIVLVFGYLLGSIPFGLVLTRLAGMGDVRKIGSGNIGATNVLRTGNKKLAAATLQFESQPFFLVLGDSECGKTETLRTIIAGLVAGGGQPLPRGQLHQMVQDGDRHGEVPESGQPGRSARVDVGGVDLRDAGGQGPLRRIAR